MEEIKKDKTVEGGADHNEEYRNHLAEHKWMDDFHYHQYGTSEPVSFEEVEGDKTLNDRDDLKTDYKNNNYNHKPTAFEDVSYQAEYWLGQFENNLLEAHGCVNFKDLPVDAKKEMNKLFDSWKNEWLRHSETFELLEDKYKTMELDMDAIEPDLN